MASRLAPEPARQTHHSDHPARPPKQEKKRSRAPILIAVLCAVLLAFLVGAGIMLQCGFDPIQFYGALFEGALGKPRAIGNTLAKATTLALCGLAMSVAA